MYLNQDVLVTLILVSNKLTMYCLSNFYNMLSSQQLTISTMNYVSLSLLIQLLKE